MATYERAKIEIVKQAGKILGKFETHEPLLKAEVKIDFVMAYAELDDDGNPTGPAIVKNGVPCLGLTRKLPLKDRAMGRGDAEITLDGDWWKQNDEAEQNAVLDHELHHISICVNRHGVIQTDDLGRPKIKLRKHDVEIGWFNIIAARHGAASTERRQAKSIADEYGQFYWPEVFSKRPPQIVHGALREVAVGTRQHIE